MPTPCLIQLEFASADALHAARAQLALVLGQASGHLISEWSAAPSASLGARHTPAALVLMLTFAGGVAEHVAGDFVVDLIRNQAFARGAGVIGTPVPLHDQDAAVAAVIKALVAHGCVGEAKGPSLSKP